MGVQLELPFMNGAPKEGYVCANCGVNLGDVRAVARTTWGVKFFCKQETGDSKEDSCYRQWMRHMQ